MIRDPDLRSILDYVEKRAGLSFRPDQLDAIAKTIDRLLLRSNIDQAPAYLSALKTNGEVFDRLVDEITIGESYFFREPRHFEFVRQCVLPEIAAQSSWRQRFRCWSAACACGEEAYSLAIVCAEQALSDRADIIATDISPQALSKARSGTFRDWSFRGDALSIVQPYLVESGDRWTLTESIRRAVRFQSLNLASNEYPSSELGIAHLDLIFCRNVLIYFHPATIRSVAERMFQCLAPGGWLVTASGDPPLAQYAPFESVGTPFGYFYQKPKTPNAAHKKPSTTEQVLESPPKALSETPISAETSPPIDALVLNPAKLSSDTARRDAVRASQSIAKLATEALESGRYREAICLTESHPQDAIACAVNIKATIELDSNAALGKCAAAVHRHTLSPELHFLHANLLMEAGRLDEALQAIQRALFLDRSAAMLHFLFGSIQVQRGQWDSAYRHFRNARDLCRKYLPDSCVPLSNGETAGHMIAAAESQLARINRY